MTHPDWTGPRPRRLAAVTLCLAMLLLGPAPASAQTPSPPPVTQPGQALRVHEIIPRVVRLDGGADRYTRSDRAERTDVALLTDVLFAFDSARLSPTAGRDLAEVAALIRAQATGAVRVEGHTDSVGAEAYNLQLSERRAAAVRDALARLLTGHPTEFQVRGLGETDPVVPNTRPDGGDNPDGRRLNRRVTVSFDR